MSATFSHTAKNIRIYVLPEMKLRGLSSNFHIQVSVSNLYIIPRLVHLFSCSRMGRHRSWEYINRSQIHECRMGLGPRSFISGNICFEFSVYCLCSVLTLLLNFIYMYSEKGHRRVYRTLYTVQGPSCLLFYKQIRR